MVTVKKRSISGELHQVATDLQQTKRAGNGRAAKAKDAEQSHIADCTFTEKVEQPLAGRGAIPGAINNSDGMVARSKDLLSDHAGGVATAAAIVVGAALIEVELIPGLIIGAGAILLGKLFPEMSGHVRPMVKSAVRAGFSMSQKAREIVAEASEQVHDLVAEVKHEQEQQPSSAKHKPAASKLAAATSDLPVH